MKKKLLFVPLFGMLLAGCSFEDLMFWKKKDDGSSEKEPENPGEKGDDDATTGSVTKTINFYGSYLSSEWTASGVSMDSTLLSCKTQNERLVNSTNSQVNSASLLSELFFTKLNTAQYDENGLIIQIGTGNPAKDNFKSGTFIWTSSKKITKVEVTAQCYTKSQGSTDTDAQLKIEAGTKGTDEGYDRPIESSTTADMSLAVEAEETPTYKTFTHEYSDGIDRFCLTSLGGRVFLKSLTITWNS